MDKKSDFQRSFLIFVNEDKGYESVQKPSGHVKIEVREGRGKLWASVQNLLESGKFGYRLYLINAAYGRSEPVPVGPLELVRGKGGIEWEFNPLNVGNSGFRIENFGVAAVLVEYRDRENASVICPLAAYREKKTLWRNGLAERLYIKKPQQDTLLKEDVTSKYGNVIESKYVPPEAETFFNLHQPYKEEVKNEVPAEQAVLYTENAGNEEFEENIEAVEVITTDNAENERNEKEDGNIEKEENENNELVAESAENVESAENIMDVESMESQYSSAEMFRMPRQEQPAPLNIEAESGQEPPAGQHTEQQAEQQIRFQTPDAGLNTDCLYLNSNMCGAYVNTGAVNPCAGCTLHNQPETTDGRQETAGLERLRMELDNNFERYDPFHVKRSDYSWWKVTNPVNLNNILFQCNIRSPLLFNPAVMVSHFKYRHLIIGIYTDRYRDKEYVVCGVFGMHMVDRKPFGDMCRWVQTEGTRPKYGAFGYWIVYLDPLTGKILSLK